MRDLNQISKSRGCGTHDPYSTVPFNSIRMSQVTGLKIYEKIRTGHRSPSDVRILKTVTKIAVKWFKKSNFFPRRDATGFGSHELPIMTAEAHCPPTALTLPQPCAPLLDLHTWIYEKKNRSRSLRQSTNSEFRKFWSRVTRRTN
jgi:hypothetical protein